MHEKTICKLKSRSNEWLNYTVVSRNFPPSFSHNIRKQHGGIKPPEYMVELIHAFGKYC